MASQLILAQRPIGIDHPPFLIAEMSGNHGGSLSRALAIVDAAAENGADAIKLQTYRAEDMVPDAEHEELIIRTPGSPWSGRHLRDLYSEAMTPWEWHAPLFERARSNGLAFLSSPFAPHLVPQLTELGVVAHKIASLEIGDTRLLQAAAGAGLPVIMSTGAATLDEVTRAVDCVRDAGCQDLVLLKCTSAYPGTVTDQNLRVIPRLRRIFSCEVGFSDHTVGHASAVAAVALGASVIEKHLTDSRSSGGTDASFSMEPQEFRLFSALIRESWESLGADALGPVPSEQGARSRRRSLYFSRALPQGHRVTESDLASLRPALGLEPRHLERLIGSRLTRAVGRGDPVRWEDLS